MNTQTAIDRTKDTASRGRDELRSEIDTLAAQVERLASDMGRIGRSSFRSARANASDGLDALSRTGAGLSKSVGRELAHVEDRAVGAVRDRPLQTVGIAIAVGFLLGAVLRR